MCFFWNEFSYYICTYMAKALAWIISILLNPIFLNLLGYCYFVYQFPVYVEAYHEQIYRLGFGILIYTFFLPLSLLTILKLTGRIQSFSLDDKTERIIPYMLFLMCYAYNFYDLYRLEIPGLLNTYAITTLLTLLYCFILNFYEKVSAHTSAIGGLMGFVFVNAVCFKTDNRPIIIILLILCGLIFWARMYLKAHKARELFMGLVGGLVIGLLVGFWETISVWSRQ